MVTSTAASGAHTILKSKCFRAAASTAEGTHSPPGAGPGEAAGTCVQRPAAVKQLSCVSPTASSQRTSSHWCFRGFSDISTLDPCTLRLYQKYPLTKTRTTGRHKVTLRLEPAGSGVLLKLTVRKD